jgi:hypothetical protein
MVDGSLLGPLKRTMLGLSEGEILKKMLGDKEGNSLGPLLGGAVVELGN